MKICGYCGTLNHDENAFCIVCRQPFQNSQYAAPNRGSIPGQTPYPYVTPPSLPLYSQQSFYPQMPIYPPSANYQTNYYNHVYSQRLRNPGVYQKIRGIAASPLMVALIILMIAQIISSILGSLLTFSNIKTSFYTSFNSTTSYFPNFLGIIPSALIAVGLFLTYNSAKKSYKPMSAAGLTMIRIISIIQMVFVCFIFVQFLIFSIIFIVLFCASANNLTKVLDYNATSNYLIILGTILFILAAAIGAFIITAYIILIRLLGSMIETIQTGCPQVKCAMAYTVFCYISGSLSLLAAIVSLIYIVSNPIPCLAFFITASIGSATNFVQGILVNKYSNAVKYV